MDRNATPDIFIRALAETATRVSAAADGLPSAALTAAPEPGTWSPNEVLWHIRATADVYGEQINRIVSEDEPRWRHVSPRARMKKARYDQLPIGESVAAFVRQRQALVSMLEQLPPAAWQRIAVVRVDKREWRLSLRELVWGMANHDEVHCARIEATASSVSAGKNAAN